MDRSPPRDPRAPGTPALHARHVPLQNAARLRSAPAWLSPATLPARKGTAPAAAHRQPPRSETTHRDATLPRPPPAEASVSHRRPAESESPGPTRAVRLQPLLAVRGAHRRATADLRAAFAGTAAQ